MKNIYKLYALFCLVLFSCDDYVEEFNINGLSADTYWKNLDESDTNLTSVYGAMLDENVLGLEYDFFRTDIAYPGNRNGPVRSYIPWHEFSYNFDDEVISNQWNSKYRVVWRANQVIEGLNSMDDDLKTTDRWKEQMGQARFFRGLMHFYLHSTFNKGDIVIRDRLAASTEDYSRTISKSSDVIAFFRKDLEYAYSNLPPKMIPVTRVDAGAAATILGTSYLYEGNYEKAKEYFSDIINNTNGDYGYQLVNDPALLHTKAGEFNSESILEINYSTNLQIQDENFDEESFFHRLARRSAPNGKSLKSKKGLGQGLLLPSAWLTYEYSNEPMDTQDPRNYIDQDMTKPMRNVPLRCGQSVAVVNDESTSYYGYTAPQVSKFSGTRFSFFKKYTSHDVDESEADSGTTGWKSGKNIIVNRLSGVYLMYAECLAKTGELSQAIFYVNEIRKRWGLQLLGVSDGSPHDFDEIVYTEETFMEHLMYKESPLELGFEGFSTRFINMRRWGITAKRFQDLSTKRFHLIDYTYTKVNEKTAVRKASLIQEGEGEDSFTEYVGAANVWLSSPENYKYFPIPQSEILYNSNAN